MELNKLEFLKSRVNELILYSSMQTIRMKDFFYISNKKTNKQVHLNISVQCEKELCKIIVLLSFFEAKIQIKRIEVNAAEGIIYKHLITVRNIKDID